jgi:hypothetical protein
VPRLRMGCSPESERIDRHGVRLGADRRRRRHVQRCRRLRSRRIEVLSLSRTLGGSASRTELVESVGEDVGDESGIGPVRVEVGVVDAGVRADGVGGQRAQQRDEFVC